MRSFSSTTVGDTPWYARQTVFGVASGVVRGVAAAAVGALFMDTGVKYVT
jgi:hypothetical protein